MCYRRDKIRGTADEDVILAGWNIIHIKVQRFDSPNMKNTAVDMLLYNSAVWLVSSFVVI